MEKKRIAASSGEKKKKKKAFSAPSSGEVDANILTERRNAVRRSAYFSSNGKETSESWM
ncbi:hypothetical protein IscW_ISCW013166 [Ixodes scapularis]|uniref:Uncharacterized protein n=1 Tax=Ixodes scapularis TaxID=6945 RepID=B7QGD8_IXOSC|nr:hypothetical protein IscW_ISCW013166 [Ixodes scapularis]|eukprot:XP_002401509.1 hypothetical protein IscW_ISCW013166 [Ixodes scapularis]